MKKNLKLLVLFAVLFLITGCANIPNDQDPDEKDPNEETPDDKDPTYEIFSITYFNGDEEITSFDLKTYTEEHEAILPILTVSGYSFVGWYTTEDFTSPVVTKIEKGTTGDLVFYAKLSIAPMLTLGFNGGTVVDYPRQYPNTKDYVLPVTSKKEGYLFAGWYNNKEFLGDPVEAIPAGSKENYLFYAKWVMDINPIIDLVNPLTSTLIETNINLPLTHSIFTISWESTDNIIDSNGLLRRPYQPQTVTLIGSVTDGVNTETISFDLSVAGYKSLQAPIASGYIYTGYSELTTKLFNTLDIINVAFAVADENAKIETTKSLSVFGQTNAYITPKAQENGIYVIMSIAPDSKWSSFVGSQSLVEQFADNIVAAINKYQFDGVDIDWEGTGVDGSQYTRLARIVNQRVKANNPNHLVTAATPGGQWGPPRFALNNSHQYLDFLNLMTYDLSFNAGQHHSALYKSSVKYDTQFSVAFTLVSCSIEESIAIYHTFGVPNSKIVVGVPFYGVIQTRQYDESTAKWTQFAKTSTISYHSIKDMYMNNSNYYVRYDETSQVPYIISVDGTTFISYDNAKSIQVKSNYIKDNGLAGMMYWQNGADNTGTLLGAIQTHLKG